MPHNLKKLLVKLRRLAKPYRVYVLCKLNGKHNVAARIAYLYNLKFPLLIGLTSCSSLFISGNEVFTEMYVKDFNRCEFKKCVIATNRLSSFGVGRLSFYLEYDSVKIHIPVMEFNPNHNNYEGGGTDKKDYIVTYSGGGDNVNIKVRHDSVIVEVSTEDICK